MRYNLATNECINPIVVGCLPFHSIARLEGGDTKLQLQSVPIINATMRISIFILFYVENAEDRRKLSMSILLSSHIIPFRSEYLLMTLHCQLMMMMTMNWLLFQYTQ